MRPTTYHLFAAAAVSVLDALSFLPSVWAASAVCKPNWGWSYNSKGQNPCEVAAFVLGPCIGEPNFELTPLQPGNYYLNPTNNTPLRKKCACNTVIFSLYMACTLCQNSTNTRTWTNWAEFCDSVYAPGQYPFDIPQNTAVPHWAYLDYTKNGSFDPSFAQSNGKGPEVTHSPGSSTSSYPTATDASNESGHGGGSKTNVGAIAGGIVGGVAALVVIAALLFFYRKRVRRMQHAHVIDLGSDTGAQWETTALQKPQTPQRLYDPSDPSTFPPPVSIGGESSTSSPAYITPARPGRYTGGAEF